MSPKKNAANTTQKPIITIELGLGSSKSNAPGRNRIANMPTTSAGDPTRIANVKRLCTNVSNVRRVRTAHCVHPFATGRLTTGRAPSAGAAPASAGRATGRSGVRARPSGCRAPGSIRPRTGRAPRRRSRRSRRVPAQHEHDAIARREVLDGVGREHDGRGLVRESAQSSDQFCTRDRIEPGRRLVQEEDVRIGEQLDGDAGALALPAAQRADPDVGLRGQPDGVERATDRVVDFARSGR